VQISKTVHPPSPVKRRDKDLPHETQEKISPYEQLMCNVAEKSVPMTNVHEQLKAQINSTLKTDAVFPKPCERSSDFSVERNKQTANPVPRPRVRKHLRGSLPYDCSITERESQACHVEEARATGQGGLFFFPSTAEELFSVEQNEDLPLPPADKRYSLLPSI